ncbi:RNA-binding protein [Saccharibacter sp. 17.LH.SD]|uniref:RNA-binding protein n=1 Tax=Saccharibacter sp. 17.LH.SD TaxID=2689393 RepID=UPI00351B244E
MENRITSNVSDIDDGPSGGGQRKTLSLRRCLLSRRHDAPENMLRFVVSPDRRVIPDLTARLPGRGMWLCADRDVLSSPQLGKAFARGARQQVKFPEGLLDLVQEGLAKRLQDGISLGRRAGEAVCGFQKCRERITTGKVGVVICATDASQDELARLMSGHRDIPVVRVPDRVLASAFGRDRAVYAVIAPGALAQRFVTEYKRFSGVANGSLPGPAIKGQ